MHKDKRINLYIKDIISEELLYELSNRYNNLYFKLNMKNYYNKDKRYDFKFFFDELINNWDTLIGLLEYGVSDIYIVENLGFELDKVAEIAAKYKVQVRVFPNVAQSSFNETAALKKFFIRPEDIDIYNKYIDIIEFYNVDDKLDIYYKIYAIDKKWLGQLNEIILDFNSDIDNKYIIPRFSEIRYKCKKRCLKGAKCNRCENIEQLADNLKKGGLMI